MRLVAIVDWVDSSLQNGQVGADDYPTPERIRSIGWLIKEGDDHVLLARDDHREDEYRGLLAIPRECIKHFDLLGAK